MRSRKFKGSEFPLNRLYTLLTRILPESEHEELRGELKELYWHLIERRHSRTDAMLRTSWQGLMFVTGICFDNIVFKTGTFQEEALRLKSFFSKLYGFCCILLFPVLYFTQWSITLTLFILFTCMTIGYLCMSLEWTFNHKNALKFYGCVVALITISTLLMITVFPHQRQMFDLYMSAIEFTSTPWLTALTVFALVTFLLILYYLTAWFICGPTAYLVAGAWYLRAIFFKLFLR